MSVFGSYSTAEEVSSGYDLTGKTYLVTGCSSGLGLETCRVLSLRGATLIGTARTVEKATEALKDFKGAIPLECELSKPESIKKCVAEMHSKNYTLDGIIANAGIMALPKLELIEGVEAQFFTNHVGHFMLITKVLDLLKDNGRVVIVSSAAHTMAPKSGIEFDNLDGSKSYAPWTAYGVSKLSNVLFAKSLAKRFEGTGKMAISLHPGLIQTNLARHMNPIVKFLFSTLGFMLYKSIPQGAATQVFAAVHKDAKAPTTCYLSDCKEAKVHSSVTDELAQKLWDETEKIVSRF